MKDNFRATIIKTLIAKSKNDADAQLLSYFSDDLNKALADSPVLSKSPLETSSTIEAFFDKIHPSWFESFLNTLPTNDAKLFISVLPEKFQNDLKNQFQLTDIANISTTSKEFLLMTLYDAIRGKDFVYDMHALPEHPLNPLVFFNSEQLHQYIKILGLYDLAVELKTIVQKQLLVEIQNAFSQEERQILKDFAKEKQHVTFKPLGLSTFTGDIEELLIVLYQRGINRLAKGLFDASPSLIWHIKHRINKQHSKAFIALKTEIKDKKIHHVLINQLLGCIELVKGL